MDSTAGPLAALAAMLVGAQAGHDSGDAGTYLEPNIGVVAQQYQDELARGRQLLREHNVPAAAGALERAVTDDPYDCELHGLLADAYTELSEAHRQRSRELVASGAHARPDAGARSFSWIGDPRDVISRWRGDLFGQERSRAFFEFEMAEMAAPNDPEVQRLLADAYSELAEKHRELSRRFLADGGSTLGLFQRDAPVGDFPPFVPESPSRDVPPR